MGGEFMIPVSSEVRSAAGVKGGDTLEVEVALDTAPRVLELPEDFAVARRRKRFLKSYRTATSGETR